MPRHKEVNYKKMGIRKKNAYKLWNHPSFDENSVSYKTLSRLRKRNENNKKKALNNQESSNNNCEKNNTPNVSSLESFSLEPENSTFDHQDTVTTTGPCAISQELKNSFITKMQNDSYDELVRNEYASLYKEISMYETLNSNVLNESSADSNSSDDNEDYTEFNHSDDESSSSDDDSDSSDDSETTEKENNRFNTESMQGYRVMFPEAGLLVSDVLLMCTTFCTKKHLGRRDQDDLIALVKILAGPQFKNWNPSHYLRSKCYDAPPDKIKLHYFCTQCNTILIIKNLNEKVKVQSVVCSKCQESYDASLKNPNYFMTIDIEYQLQLLLNQPTL